jgi:hypothetical protein
MVFGGIIYLTSKNACDMLYLKLDKEIISCVKLPFQPMN